VKSAELTDQIVVADFEITPLVSKLYVLRFPAYDGMLENPVAVANPRKTLDNGIRPDIAIDADFHVVFDNGGRVDRHS
jgi:hypothetical protein